VDKEEEGNDKIPDVVTDEDEDLNKMMFWHKFYMMMRKTGNEKVRKKCSICQRTIKFCCTKIVNNATRSCVVDWNCCSGR
jgi:hypothetical protein